MSYYQKSKHTETLTDFIMATAKKKSDIITKLDTLISLILKMGNDLCDTELKHSLICDFGMCQMI